MATLLPTLLIQAQASQVLGDKVNITARDSNINIIGSDVSGSTNTDLSAAKNVNIASFEEIYTNRSQNKSFGWNAGVAVEFGQGMSLGFTGGANYGKGHANADSTTHRNSHVGSNTGKTTITAGETLNIKGGQVAGKGVDITAKDLNIESLQDTMTYDSRQENVSGSITVGYGVSGSASYSKSKVNADYASVNEQSGIFAGDDGYRINVKNHTDLKGGLITSTDKAEKDGKNSFSTGTISFADIANRSEYSSSSFGVGLSGSMGGGESMPKEVGGQKLMTLGSNKTFDLTEPDGTPTGESKTVAMGSLKTQTGIGHDSESQHSVTHSGINTANIVVTDENKQKELTGKTADETIGAIKTDVTVENYAEHTGSLKNNFDKEKVLKELNLQVEVTKDFSENAKATIAQIYEPKQAKLREEIKELEKKKDFSDPNSEEWKVYQAEQDKLYDEIYKLQYQRRILETVVGVVALDPDTAITQGLLQGVATKLRRETLDNSRKFPGIVDKNGKVLLSNVSYDSDYFDGVKLGGVRVDVQAICGENFTDRCVKNPNGTYTFIKDPNRADGIATFNDAMKPEKNPAAKGMYGATGGVQGLMGTMIGNPYPKGSFFWDTAVEGFAGTHDYTGGQMWGFYDEVGNTTPYRRTTNKKDAIGSSVTAAVAIPVAAPFAIADIVDHDFIQAIMKITGH